MSEKMLIERGAECVSGDLILGRQVVGKYRDGQFIMTPEGMELVTLGAAEKPQAVPAEPAAKPGRSPKARAAKPAEPAPEPAVDPVDNLLSGLDEALQG